ncbi:MAG: SpoVG family protein [Candidatus Omnitrophica bacterium]|nr:SpoVG family protein [Candidatus Omnitrophota bacterium]
MKIEVVRIHKLDGTGPTKAFADIALDESIIIKGVRIIEGKDGLFVSLPREEGRDGKWYNTVVPLSREIKEMLDTTVLEAYNS